MSQDTKRLVIGMSLALAVLIGYQYVLRVFYPDWKPGDPDQKPPPAVASTTQSSTTASATRPTTTGPSAGPATATAGPATGTGPGTPTSPGAATATAPAWTARPAAGPATAPVTRPTVLGSDVADDPRFAMALRTSTWGAGIEQVVLNRFRKTAEDLKTRYTFQEPYVIAGTPRLDSRSLMTRSIVIDGKEIDLSGVPWRLENSTADSVTYAIEVLQASEPVARVTKTYTLTPGTRDPKTPQGYEVGVAHKIQNLSGRSINAHLVMNGPTEPPKELERQPDQAVVLGYAADGGILPVAHLVEGEFTKEKPFREFTKDEKGRPMAWGGTQSAYFLALVRPVPAQPNEPAAAWVQKVAAELMNPEAEPAADRRSRMWFETADQAIPAKEARDLRMELYFGPKSREVLQTEYYAQMPRHFDSTLVIRQTSGFGQICAACTWEWLINSLVWLLSIFHLATRDWGLAIIILVLIVRALLHPITKKSQVHMVRMQKLGPEMEKLKKRFADNKEELARAQMTLYKEQGLTPILGCLPMFLQMPIWIALWNALQSTFELRHAPFLYGFTWIHDLAQPDYLVKFNHPIPLIFGWTLAGINLLPIGLAVVFYLQSKLQPKPPTMTPEQEQQQKMMVWMSTLMFPLLLYSGPSGLNLYILTSTAFGIMESKVIRKHIKEREELEAKRGPTIVDGPPPEEGGGSGAKRKPGKGPQPPAKQSWMDRMKEKMTEIQKQAEKRK